ncbi:ATP-binding protein [Sulfolobus sp. S-194]|uniref:ATP-binding protein n=1 Tax=Sulfolobus sp. S-194 TaxID=2512240 RepID=UPI0014373C4F|nr:ATP-binding protein [Sulfolobus sp. S-194]QIW23798.1 ATP-binding protein [Sulfolobus sp. S-194]
MECYVIGPPQAGKTRFQDYLKDKCISIKEQILGYTKTTIPQTQGASLLDSLVRVFYALFPRIKGFLESEKKDLNKLTNFSKHELELIGDYLKQLKRVPKGMMDYLDELGENHAIIVYHIPWDVKENQNQDVNEVIKMITMYFNKEHGYSQIKWLGKEYIPPGLISEVIRRAREERCSNIKDCNAVREFVKSQAKAYHEILKILVGERDLEYEGVLGLSIIKSKDSVHEFLSNLIGTVILAVTPIIVSVIASAIVLTMFQMLAEERKEGITNKVIRLKENWEKLSETLKEIIAWKVAIQFGVDPKDVKDAINYITGLDIDKIKSSLKGLEKKIELIEQQLKDFKIYKLKDIEDGLLYANVKLVDNYLSIISETYDEVKVSIVETGKFDEYSKKLIEELRKGLVVIKGPKGVGKSTLAVYIIWNLLKDEYGGVIKVYDLADSNSKDKLENFLEVYKRNYLKYFGKLIILYDPLSTEVYKSPSVRANVSRVNDTVKQLIDLVNNLTEYNMSMLIVIPEDLYNTIDPNVKERLETNIVNVNLDDLAFLSEIIRSYAGKNVDKINSVEDLAREVAKYKDGYALIARLVGEWIRWKGDRIDFIVEQARKFSDKSALSFITSYVEDMLGLIARSDATKKKLLKAYGSIQELRIKYGVGMGEYWIPPELLSHMMQLVGINDDMIDFNYKWLALIHEDLIEEAIREVVVPDENSVRRLLSKLYERIIHGDENSEKLFKESCWHKFALILGSALTHQPLEKISKVFPRIDSDKTCDIDNYLLVNDRLTSFTTELMDKIITNGNISELFGNKYKDMINEIRTLLERWKDQEAELWERVYALGLSILIAKVSEKKKIEKEDAEITLRAASYATRVILRDAMKTLNLLKPLSKISPGSWIPFISYGVMILPVEQYPDLGEWEWKSLEELSKDIRDDWEIAHLIRAYAGLVKSYDDAVCKAFMLLDKIKDHSMKTIAMVYLYNYSIYYGLSPCNKGDWEKMLNDLKKDLEKISCNQINKEIKNFLRYISFSEPEKVCEQYLREANQSLIFDLAILQFNSGNFNKASRLLEEIVKSTNQQKDWSSYIPIKSYLIRSKVLRSKNLDELINSSKEFKDLLEESRKYFKPTGAYLNNESRVLAEYLVHLSITNNREEIERSMREYGWLFDYLPSTHYTWIKLFLNWLNIVKDMPSAKEILGVLDLDDTFKPALKKILNVSVESDNECNNSELSNYACSAVEGDIKGFEDLVSAVKRESDFVDKIANYNPKAFIQAISCKNIKCYLILVLNALVNDDYETVKAITETVGLRFSGTIVELFRELGEAIDKKNEAEIKLGLAKLYYLHM